MINLLEFCYAGFIDTLLWVISAKCSCYVLLSALVRITKICWIYVLQFLCSSY